jgi:leader peptidase (prepilin peptidase)/N-methyltransferase
MPPTVALTFFTILGLCIGSFLNVCVSRWPAGLSIVSPRSRCPKCERQIRAIENIPVVSWIALRARCRGCGERISIEYPLVELIVGAIWFWSAYHFGPNFTAVRVAVFATILLGIALTDARHYVIPDGFTISGLVWVLGTSIVALFMGDYGPFESPFASPYEALIGACAGAGAIAIVGWLGEASLKKEAMGFGDVTLMAVAGAALGAGRALLTIFVAAALGAVVFLLIVLPIAKVRSSRRKEPFTIPLVPFGVFLAPAAVISLLWGREMIAWYMRLTGL